jgi:hypothetical protein
MRKEGQGKVKDAESRKLALSSSASSVGDENRDPRGTPTKVGGCSTRAAPGSASSATTPGPSTSPPRSRGHSSAPRSGPVSSTSRTAACTGSGAASPGTCSQGRRDAALALQYIGDVDLTMASQYLKRRSERLHEAADVVDARPDPSPNRPAPPARWSPDSEVPSDAELVDLGREDSNLQLPNSRGPRAPHRTKRDKKLSNASNAEQAPAERKVDTETVTKPSTGSSPKTRS